MSDPAAIRENDWAAFRQLAAVHDHWALTKRMGRRKSWKDDEGNTYEWDYQHGAVEKYNKNGKHLGEYDAETGAQTKPGDSTRKPQWKK